MNTKQNLLVFLFKKSIVLLFLLAVAKIRRANILGMVKVVASNVALHTTMTRGQSGRNSLIIQSLFANITVMV